MNWRITLYSVVNDLQKNNPDCKKGVTPKHVEAEIGDTGGSAGKALDNAARTSPAIIKIPNCPDPSGRKSTGYKLTKEGLAFLKKNAEQVMDEEQIELFLKSAKPRAKQKYRKRKEKPLDKAVKNKTTERALQAVSGITELLEENDNMRSALESMERQLSAMSETVHILLNRK